MQWWLRLLVGIAAVLPVVVVVVVMMTTTDFVPSSYISFSFPSSSFSIITSP